MSPHPLDLALAPQPPAFALLHRPETTGPGMVDVIVGDVSTPSTLAGLPLSDRPGEPTGPRHDVLAVIPYRQIAERGYACVDDGAPLIALTVTDSATVPIGTLLARIPETEIRLSGGRFDVDDETYAETVRAVIENEIGRGEGSNFVIKRSFVTEITGYTLHSALVLFRRLLERESGTYWTFIVHTGDRTFVGATPERHISLRDGTAVMNPISGTYRYPPSGPTLHEVMDFLADRKEADELYMVVDEELKMMARICDLRLHVEGPYLKEMAKLAHTEYFLHGCSTRDPREILRETMFAPTVTGSPLENACRVISRHEPQGRGYYSGVVALIGSDEHGGRTLDSSILIRTAEIDRGGRLRIGTGATLVRHSDPASEVAETHAKAAGLLGALQANGQRSLGEHPEVRAALERRNAAISTFWLSRGSEKIRLDQTLAARRVLVVDAEDTFTSMLDHQLRSLGLSVAVRRFTEPRDFDDYDLVVMGPGPGDPCDRAHPKIAHLYAAVRTLLDERRPFLAVCLSHQVLAAILGFDLVRCQVPNQGLQREIDLFGARERVGFYNSFTAHSNSDKVEVAETGLVEVSRDIATGEVHALRGPHFASIQFHAESLLTTNGNQIIGSLLRDALGT
ncbi:phenazine-specific anthranilate synthase component I [Microtetraspora sp. NBRC 13810]|uniref:anthranilate synthase family protein n=1 Tax=Microtetraspora sp. NBRC 13810 TaxID=3030990 RepID=UPI0024A2B406|nr:anthranilate synthase family protein [Microtetraspora sp. NBRC 13810]GLW09398.1 phenazine-specific anthranilate synthase component I [Microtetraspora sp. NBRC 13810]